MSFAPGATIWTQDRRTLILDKLIKSGGAGSVYLLRDSKAQVAKIYHPGSDLANYQRKIAAMLSLSPELPDIDENGHRYVQIAWPQTSIQDERGNFIGFLMPILDIKATIELEYILQERQALAAGLPTGLGTKITLAANLSAVISELHRRGHYVVDLKPVNLRFYRQSLYLAMLDCDGFSIQGGTERFPALQYTPDYLAPEFQSTGLTASSEDQQDRFALAVIVFQLLNFGLHPFTGRPVSDAVPTDIPGRIARRYYPYGLQPNPAMAPSPVSGHTCLPAALRVLFDRAFQGPALARPTAAEWASTLQVFAQRSSNQLVTCSKNEKHQHFVGLNCAACARDALLITAKRAGQAKKLAARTAIGKVMGGWQTTPPAQFPQTPTVPTWRQQTRATRPSPYPQQAPHPRPSPQPFPNPGNQISITTVFRALIIFSVIMLKLCSNSSHSATVNQQDPQSSPEANSISPPTQTKAIYRHVEQDPSTRACYSPNNHELDDAGRMVHIAADGMTSGEVSKVNLAFSNLHRYATGIDSHADALPDSYQEAFVAFSQRSEFDDDLARDALIEVLESYMHNHPNVAEAAYERGWLALTAKEPSVAVESFLCSIEMDPSLPQNWYGLAVAGEDNRAGFLAMAKILSPDEKTSERVRSQFTAKVLERAYLDQRSFLHMDIYGQQLAAQMRIKGVTLTEISHVARKRR